MSTKSEEQKLVEWFREHGERIALQGDHDNLSPAETAIRAMEALQAATIRSRAVRMMCRDRGVI